MRRWIFVGLSFCLAIVPISCLTLGGSVNKQVSELNDWGKMVIRKSFTEQEILQAALDGEPFGSPPERILRDEDGFVLHFRSRHFWGRILQYSLQIGFVSEGDKPKSYRVYFRGFESIEERTE